MAKPTWLGRNEMESRQEKRGVKLSCIPAFLIQISFLNEEGSPEVSR
jgi:hypothetical protein